MRVLILAFVAFTALAQKPAPPREALLAFAKGVAAGKAGRDDEALRNLEQAVALFPPYAEAWYQLGKLRLAHKDTTGAKAAFQAAIRADPKYLDPYKPLVTMEQEAGNWKELVDLTGRFLKLDAVDYPLTWLLNAVGNYNLHNLEAAEKSAREAERLDTRQHLPEAWRMLGLILEQRGDFPGAVEQYRTYLKLVPSGTYSDSVRERLAEAEKHAGKASIPDSGLTFRSETNLAVVRFQVHPNKGGPARNLTAEDIEIREDGVAQQVALFEGGPSNTRTIPVEVSLLFDCSGSVERIAALSAGVFRESILDEYPNVSLAVYGFSDNLVRFATPTREPGALKKALDLVASIPKRDTPLFGSIADTTRDAAATGANVIRMVVVFSDGESSTPGDESRADDAVRAARESGAAIFPVLLDKPGGSPMSSLDSIHEFMSLAGATGGREFKGFMGTDVLPSVLKAVSAEIRQDYIAGFYVPASSGKKRHQVEVALHSKNLGKLSGGTRAIVY